MTIISIEGYPFVTFERIGDFYKCNCKDIYKNLSYILHYITLIFVAIILFFELYRVLHHKPAKSICLLRIQGKLIFQIHIQLQGKVRI